MSGHNGLVKSVLFEKNCSTEIFHTAQFVFSYKVLQFIFSILDCFQFFKIVFYFSYGNFLI